MTRRVIAFCCSLTFLASLLSAQATYTDDVDKRRLAHVEFQPSPDRLRMVISATGGDVDSQLGFEGVSGANRFTAEQFDLLLGQSKVAVISRNVATGETSVGTFRGGRRGAVPVRLIRADGSIDYLARWPVQLPLKVVVESGPMGEGRYETEIRVEGKPRARITSVSKRSGLVVEGFESLDGHGSGFLAAFAADPSKPAPPPPLVIDHADWARRDMEGKWVLYMRRIAENPKERPSWVPFLIAQKEFELLEWLAIYQADGFSSQGIGNALLEADAPQWMRVAAWNRTNQSGHGDGAADWILSARPGVTLWWMRKYPQAAAGREALLKSFEEKKTIPIPSPLLLPPLEPAEVFAHLDAPPELVIFVDRTSVESGRVYEHQVLRAIRGVVAASATQPPWVDKLRALTRHSNPNVRRESFLAFTHKQFGPLPREDVLRVIDDASEPTGVREAAALAYSYIDHPSVYVKLHAIASDVAHPAWRPAVSRLGDLGDGFSRTRLTALNKLPPDGAAIVNDALRRIGAREAHERNVFAHQQPGSQDVVKRIRTRLHRAAWADLHRDPLSDELLAWTTETTRKQAADYVSVRAAIDWIDREPDDRPDSSEEARPLRERVSAIAKSLLR